MPLLLLKISTENKCDNIYIKRNMTDIGLLEPLKMGEKQQKYDQTYASSEMGI